MQRERERDPPRLCVFSRHILPTFKELDRPSRFGRNESCQPRGGRPLLPSPFSLPSPSPSPLCLFLDLPPLATTLLPLLLLLHLLAPRRLPVLFFLSVLLREVRESDLIDGSSTFDSFFASLVSLLLPLLPPPSPARRVPLFFLVSKEGKSLGTRYPPVSDNYLVRTVEQGRRKK